MPEAREGSGLGALLGQPVTSAECGGEQGFGAVFIAAATQEISRGAVFRPGDTIVTLFYQRVTILYLAVTKKSNKSGKKIHRYRIDPMTVPKVTSGAAVVDSVNSGGSESTTAPPRDLPRTRSCDTGPA